jgi:hypothetical protein
MEYFDKPKLEYTDPKEKICVGDMWTVKREGVFLDIVKVKKVGWFSVRVIDSEGKERNIHKVDFVEKV